MGVCKNTNGTNRSEWMMKKSIFVTILLVIMTIVSFTFVIMEDISQNQMEEKLVVTSFYPIYIATLNVVDGMENIRLENLTEPTTGCLHDYQLSPQDMVLLSQADLLIINGGGMEGFLEDVITQYPNLEIVTATEGIAFLSSGEADMDGEGETEGEEHEHGDHNAHVWMDMEKYCIEVENIKEGMIRLDETNKMTYENNCMIYQEKISELNNQVKGLIGEERKSAILFHDAFAYFANMFHFTIENTINMDENQSLSATQFAHVIDTINAGKVSVLFAEEQYGVKLADAIETETDKKVLILDALTTGDHNKDAYLEGMKRNIDLLKGVLH